MGEVSYLENRVKDQDQKIDKIRDQVQENSEDLVRVNAQQKYIIQTMVDIKAIIKTNHRIICAALCTALAAILGRETFTELMKSIL